MLRSPVRILGLALGMVGAIGLTQPALARPVLNQSPETLRRYFGPPLAEEPYEDTRTGNPLVRITYDPNALSQAIPEFGPEVTFSVIYSGDRAQKIDINPRGRSQVYYGSDEGRRLFQYVFGYRAPIWFSVPGPRTGIEGVWKERACLGDGIRTKWSRIAPTVMIIALDYDQICEPPYKTFPDVENHWSKHYVKALVARNILKGYPDGTFRPDAWVTRAEFAAMISAAYSPPAQRSPVDFSDVSTSFWAAKTIREASAGGYLRGYPDGTFRPQAPILRQDVYVALMGGFNFPPEDGDRLNQFKGGRSVPAYARRPLAGAIAKRMVVNYPLVYALDVGRPANRADVAAALYRGLVVLERAEPLSPYSSYIAEFSEETD